MRYAPEHKETVRESIVSAAAKALRKEGLEGVSIPALMKKVGLTHGGFYAHFRNRDELVAAAVLAAAESTGDGVLSEKESLEASVRAYLSEGHMKHPSEGCVLAALGSEGRRQPSPVRNAFATAAKGFLAILEHKLQRTPQKDSEGQRITPKTLSDETLVRASQMVGAIVLARLVNDDALSAKILAAVSKASAD